MFARWNICLPVNVRNILSYCIDLLLFLNLYKKWCLLCLVWVYCYNPLFCEICHVNKAIFLMVYQFVLYRLTCGCLVDYCFTSYHELFRCIIRYNTNFTERVFTLWLMIITHSSWWHSIVYKTAAVAQWVWALVHPAEFCVFESQPRQT